MRGFKKTILIMLMLGGVFLGATGVKAASLSTFVLDSNSTPGNYNYVYSTSTGALPYDVYFYLPATGTLIYFTDGIHSTGFRNPYSPYPTENYLNLTSYFPYDYQNGGYLKQMIFDTYEGEKIQVSDTSGAETYYPFLSPSVSFNYPTATSTPWASRAYNDTALNFSNLTPYATYNLYIFNGADSNAPVIYYGNTQNGNDTSLQNILISTIPNSNYWPPTLLPNTNYTWTVQLEDANFNVLSTSSVNFTTANDIAFNYPTSSSTINPSFSDWSLNFADLSTSTTYQAEVVVSTTPIVANEETFLGYEPNYMTYYFKSNDVNTNIYSSNGSLNNISVIKTENLNYGTTYYAAAALFDNFLNIIATSSIVFNTASSSLYLEPYATTTFNTTTPPLLTTTTPPTPPIFSENSASSTCSQYGFIGNSICEAGLFLGNVLFIPSTSTLAQWGSLSDLIKTKPPVGYFYAALDALNSLRSGSGANLLISSSTLLAFSVVFNPLDTGLAVILWIVFAFYIIKRLKQVEL